MKRMSAIALLVLATALLWTGNWHAAADRAPWVAEETAPTPDEAGTPTLSWALRPATTEEADGRVSLRHTLDAGAEITDSLALTNFSRRAVSFNIYASDGIITDTGHFDLAPRGVTVSGGGSWITVATIDGATRTPEGGITIHAEAGQTVIVPVTINVPANATPGDHPAGIVAELDPGSEQGVTFSTRIGVRAHLRVSGDVVPHLQVDDVQVTHTPSWNPFTPGVLGIQYRVTNVGNVRLGAEAGPQVHGPFGLLPSSGAGEWREILPGQSVAHHVELPVWPLLHASGDVGGVSLLVGEDDVEATLIFDPAGFTAWTMPWAQLLLLAAVVGAVVAVRFQRRRSRAAVQARIDAAVAAATAATATSQADSVTSSDAGADTAS